MYLNSVRYSIKTMAVFELNLNDLLTLKKPHACGGYEWKITRTGADFKILCLSCGRTVLVERDKLNKMIKEKN